MQLINPCVVHFTVVCGFYPLLLAYVIFADCVGWSRLSFNAADRESVFPLLAGRAAVPAPCCPAGVPHGPQRQGHFLVAPRRAIIRMYLIYQVISPMCNQYFTALYKVWFAFHAAHFKLGLSRFNCLRATCARGHRVTR